jgi:hypothetical protein
MTAAETGTDWGVLTHPLRDDVAPNMPAWKDNAVVYLWDLANDVYGVIHWSTSPNAEGRRAQCHLLVEGHTVELVEPLEPGSFCSESIEFDLDRQVRISSLQIEAELRLEPRFALADYSQQETVPSLVEGEPLRHYERGVATTGRLKVNGREIDLNAVGIRDRTWGYRDESANWSEYIALISMFDDCAITCIRALGADGSDNTHGYVLRDDSFDVLDAISITRDATGLFVQGEMRLADSGEILTIRTGRRRGGFFLPMGWERKGPAMSAYDQFDEVQTSDGAIGFAMIENGIIRHLS